MQPAEDSELAGRIRCTVAVEHLGAAAAPNRLLLRDAWVTLGRNEFRELVLQVTNTSGPGRLQNFPLRQNEMRLFTRFVKDGKSSIRLGPLGSNYVQLLLSNCPPDRLRRFVQTLRIKFEATQHRMRPVAERTRLLSSLPRTFDTVSPVQVRDLQQTNTREALAKVTATPTKGQTLRCRSRKRPMESVDGRQMTEEQQVKKPWLMSSRATLSQEQSRVLSAVLSGKNVFFTGSAGTGKSYLLKKIVASFPPNGTYVTASTGVAACQIGGITLHAFAGIGSGKAPLHQCLELAQRPRVRQQWLNCRCLIIDEISMVEGEFFDKLEAVARDVRKCEDPFGGIHLIICGDFLQLPPVAKDHRQPKFCFQAKSWRKCIHLNMELTEVRRQTDKEFISLLNAVRLGRGIKLVALRLDVSCAGHAHPGSAKEKTVTIYHDTTRDANEFDTRALLQSDRWTEEVNRLLTQTVMQKVERDGILATRLCTHKDDVEFTNTMQLRQLSGQLRSFKAVDSDPMLAKTLDAQCPVKSIIELKEGAQVMLTKNLDVSQGLVNGARGVVIGFETEGKGPAGTYLTRQQIPLKLAWAISIHKSQGMTLDCAEVSLARVFESGQAYVALSRARSLASIRVLDFEAKVVRANPCVLRFYKELKRDQFLNQASLHSYIHVGKENEKVKGT
ncbi:ATP-dependent DNA helicase PIF1 isoform X2 [Crotalus tigris]|uniref:ATP-dependent DNA helicase PIF1 isoform X2 n=1 Tax=Crotalus tigris TaxID=88082 RepID=UPI00192F4E60|nr:ATP-dependent DNA helicase PIF1 isoform X2 [Crotalus tigris]